LELGCKEWVLKKIKPSTITMHSSFQGFIWLIDKGLKINGKLTIPGACDTLAKGCWICWRRTGELRKTTCCWSAGHPPETYMDAPGGVRRENSQGGFSRSGKRKFQWDAAAEGEIPPPGREAAAMPIPGATATGPSRPVRRIDGRGRVWQPTETGPYPYGAGIWPR
jgi:hypothetical protein